jgi:hypothetical protein
LRILGVLVVLFFAALATVASLCSGGNSDTISVRLFDGTTGKPMARVSILVGVPAGNKNANQLRDITNSQGTARFNLSDLIPDQIHPNSGPDVVMCPSWTFTTEQILKTGVIADTKCAGKNFEYDGHPIPGNWLYLQGA